MTPTAPHTRRAPRARSTPPARHAAESAARHVGPAALLAAPGDTVAALRERLRRQGSRGWELLCVVDDDGRLRGALDGAGLAAAPDDATLAEVARHDHPSVPAHIDQERMASIALERGVTALPVVDGDGRLVGVVGAAALMGVLRREHVEDLHRLAGITRETTHARHAMEAPPLRRVRHRLPWLLVGFAGSVLATFIVARFEHTLAAVPALAFFVPALVYLADAIGTQSEAVTVRGLSLSHVGIARLVGGELRTGALLGLVLAALAFPLVWLAFGQARLAASVALTLGAVSMLASVLGLVLPWALSRTGADPAYGSGPLATIVQDVLTLLIYFGVASLILL